MTEENTGWTEENSRFFIDYARYFVPDRESQIRAIASLIPPLDEPFRVMELCCGEGSLAGALLEKFPECTVYGLDGSHEMVKTARQRLAAFGSRFMPGKFDLASSEWRTNEPTYHAVVSSLAVHHLDDRQKARLFQDLHGMLLPGGVIMIADVIRPASPMGMKYAADAYDDAVLRQSLEIDGSQHAFDLFSREQWNLFRFPDDPVDRPSTLFDQLKWLEQAGFTQVDVFWLRAGHAIFGGTKE